MMEKNFLEKEIWRQDDSTIKMDVALNYANQEQLKVGDVNNPRNKPVIMVFADRPYETEVSCMDRTFLIKTVISYVSLNMGVNAL